MSETTTQDVIRQTIPLPGCSCDIRLGKGAITQLGREARVLVGHPKRAAVLFVEGVAPELCEQVRRELRDAGFTTADIVVGTGRNFSLCASVMAQLSDAGITQDDCIVAVGTTDTLSVASFVSSSWCTGTSLIAVPSDPLAVALALSTPCALDVDGKTERMVSARSWARLAFCDMDYISLEPSAELEAATAIAAQTAVCDNTDAFTHLASRAQALAERNYDAWCEQLLETARCRGRIISSTAIAVRQGLLYGEFFAEAMRSLFDGVPDGILLAEGLRVDARLAVGAAEGEVDFVFAQDALLAQLGLGEVACDVEPAELIDAIKQVCYTRSNRFMLPLPQKQGRVRLTNVDEQILNEHLAAWCEARRALMDAE